MRPGWGPPSVDTLPTAIPPPVTPTSVAPPLPPAGTGKTWLPGLPGAGAFAPPRPVVVVAAMALTVPTPVDDVVDPSGPVMPSTAARALSRRASGSGA